MSQILNRIICVLKKFSAVFLKTLTTIAFFSYGSLFETVNGFSFYRFAFFMRKKLTLLVFSLGLMSVCSAENPTLLIPQSSLIENSLPLGEEDEVKTIDQLISATTQQLEAQKQIKELMLQFKKLREEFVLGNQSKSHTSRMVRGARQIYEMITANHIEHLFAKDYLDELTFFSSIAGKTAVTRP